MLHIENIFACNTNICINNILWKKCNSITSERMEAKNVCKTAKEKYLPTVQCLIYELFYRVSQTLDLISYITQEYLSCEKKFLIEVPVTFFAK